MSTHKLFSPFKLLFAIGFWMRMPQEDRLWGICRNNYIVVCGAQCKMKCLYIVQKLLRMLWWSHRGIKPKRGLRKCGVQWDSTGCRPLELQGASCCLLQAGIHPYLSGFTDLLSMFRTLPHFLQNSGDRDGL